MAVLFVVTPIPTVLVSARQQDAASADLHVVDLPSRTVRLSAAQWKAMPNEYEWAVNFEQVRRDRRYEFPRVVTIFKLPMTDDRRNGVRISPNEYVEMFVVSPGTLTVQVRLDKGGYWVMSRETFTAKALDFVDTANPHGLTDEEFGWARRVLQAEIDTTRFLIQSVF